MSIEIKPMEDKGKVLPINTSPLVKTYTLEEFWQLPDPPNGEKLELIAGVLYMTPPPDQTHNKVEDVQSLRRITERDLSNRIRDKGCGWFVIPNVCIKVFTVEQLVTDDSIRSRIDIDRNFRGVNSVDRDQRRKHEHHDGGELCVSGCKHSRTRPHIGAQNAFINKF